MEPVRNAILIAGPTASGKSALALDLARRRNGVIVNADSMQVYSVLNLITARPGVAELSAVQHLLYGHVHPGVAYSTGAWLRDVEQLLANGALSGRTPIFTGGTGLYFRALLGGLAEMPPIPQAVRDRWRGELAGRGAEELYRQLCRDDPPAAAEIHPTDGQRIVRALEVNEVSGRSITALRAQTGRPLADPETAERYVVEQDRTFLHQRISERFDAMVEGGALDEAKALAELNLDPALPAMKAIGVRELQAVLAGQLPLPAAIERAKAATRQYAKRQMTWFRHQLGFEWKRISPFAAGQAESFQDSKR